MSVPNFVRVCEMGARDGVIRSIFVYQGISLVAKGLLFGNVIGLGLCYLQDTFKFIKLNPHDYYMSYVPIDWDWTMVVVLNLLMFSVVLPDDTAGSVPLVPPAAEHAERCVQRPHRLI